MIFAPMATRSCTFWASSIEEIGLLGSFTIERGLFPEGFTDSPDALGRPRCDARVTYKGLSDNREVPCWLEVIPSIADRKLTRFQAPPNMLSVSFDFSEDSIRCAWGKPLEGECPADSSESRFLAAGAHLYVGQPCGSPARSSAPNGVWEGHRVCLIDCCQPRDRNPWGPWNRSLIPIALRFFLKSVVNLHL